MTLNAVLFLQNVGLLNKTIILLCEISASERKKNTRETLVAMPRGNNVMSKKDSCKPNTQKD